MGYMHIDNLYKSQDVLMFKRCYAMEKIHGTSAHVGYKEGKVTFFGGGIKHETFVKLFDEAALLEKFKALGPHCELEGVTVYGEAYGGSCQGMSHTYGKDLKFIVFDIKMGNVWLAVPQMDDLAKTLGFEVVHWEEGPTDLAWLDAQMNAPSVQAKRNGILEDKPREGIVVRPPFEVRKNNDERVMAKHKGDSFKETATPRPVVDPEKLKVLQESQAIADEWVTDMRLEHVLQKLPADIGMEGVRTVIAAMVEDVTREAKGEIVDSPEARKAISKKTADMFKARLKSKIKEVAG
jgi:hypothetical protein